MKKLSERILDAYMVGDKEEAGRLVKEAEELSKVRQRSTKVSPVAVNTILNNPNASPINIYDFLNKSFGEDWWQWEYETLEQLLWTRYGAVLEPINADKIWAIKHLCNSNKPFRDWYEFNQIAIAFGGAIADFEVIKSPSPGMIVNAVTAMQYIRPEEAFDIEVKKYICVLLHAEGIYTPLPSLTALIKDDMAEFVSSHTKEAWPNVYKRYQKIIEDKDAQLNETITDIQVRRLIHAEEAALAYQE